MIKYILAGLLAFNVAMADVLVQPRVGLPNQAAEVAKFGKIKGHIKQINVYRIEGNVVPNSKKFQFAEIDAAVAPDLIPSDPSYGSSWALPKIGAPVAWDYGTGASIKYAVLDSGAYSQHQDLIGNMLPGYNFYDNNTDTTDLTGHGTWVTGTVAMMLNNGYGSVGVSPHIQVFPIRVTEPVDGYGYYSMMASGLTWSADRGARVANMSFQNVYSSSTIHAASDYFRKKNSGLVFGSAGNTGARTDYPNHPSIIAVAATDSNDNKASWSSWGPFVDLAAPGVSIYSTSRTGGYQNVSGTSFSSPIAGGVAALLMSINPNLSNDDVEFIMKATAKDLGTAGWDEYFGAGRVDAAAAAAMAFSYVPVDNVAPTVSITSPTGGYVNGLVPIDITYADNIRVVKTELFVNGTSTLIDDLEPYGFIWNTENLNGTYNLVVKAYDAAGNVGTSNNVSVNVGSDSVAPVITSFTLTPVRNQIRVSAAAWDNIGVSQMTVTANGKLIATSSSGTISASFNTNKAKTGSVTVTARDAFGNSISQTKAY